MNIIGLSAKAGCGKTTTAKHLLRLIPGSVRLAFGDPLKREASTIYGFHIDLAYTEAGKSSMIALSQPGEALMGKSFAQVREILQYHGTELRRAQDQNYWLGAMERELNKMHSQGFTTIIVDDTRFPGEFDLLEQFGAKQFRIDPYPEWTPGEHAAHQSETALDTCIAWDMIFAPNKGLHHLEAVAYSIVEMTRLTDKSACQ